MPAHFEMFNKFITKHVDFTEDELVAFKKKCTQVNFSKGELIMKAGEHIGHPSSAELFVLISHGAGVR